MLEIKNLGYTAGDGAEIVRHIDLKTDQRFIAVTGPNGGGKSTLAKLIAGLYQPSEGQILLDGTDITHMSITERANLGISYAFQQPVRLKGLKVGDMLRLAAGRDKKNVDYCSFLSEVGLCAKDYINREINASLSGGELKRIEIAMALARSTKLTIFDEPEAGIDLWSFRNLIEVFRKLRGDIQDSSILIISHQERILSIADEIIVLRDGRVEKQGTREEIYPQLIRAETDVLCEGWAGTAAEGGNA